MGDHLLLPGDNYSERLMFTVESYKETWVDGRAARLYADAYAALHDASELSKADRKELNKLKQQTPNTDFGDVVDFALDLYDTGKKGARFSRAAAPLILADGPLPFGDTVFVIALGLDFAIAAYNLVNRDD